MAQKDDHKAKFLMKAKQIFEYLSKDCYAMLLYNHTLTIDAYHYILF